VRTGVYDLVLSEAIYRLLDPGELAVDAGASIGYTVSIMATRLRPSGHVLAFEPNPRAFALLEANVARWPQEPIAAVVLHQVALSDHSGGAVLSALPTSRSNQSAQRSVHSLIRRRSTPCAWPASTRTSANPSVC
jgi:FkbM family methyltransferase